jgi:hypothetical protein
MMTMMALLALAGDYDLSKTGLPWVEGIEAAKKSGKPILLFQLLGRLDDVHC